ncbi:hypothetical protein DSO57_1012394 [Entomophthora muscae]|uniref:Uncharacterized protein n=1 Tax=Entomophthora muscae TaxID=34485 RepID=A0ACC2UFS4_9FUNG|nr:hypothetical protein DSO57_1012394 [Entomophthora muscae]
MIRKYLSNIKINKLAELDEPLSGDNVFLRHEARILASRLRFSDILEEITTETTAGAIRLATYLNLTLPGPWKDNAQVNASTIYQEKINQYFSSEVSDYLPEKHLVQFNDGIF